VGFRFTPHDLHHTFGVRYPKKPPSVGALCCAHNHGLGDDSAANRFGVGCESEPGAQQDARLSSAAEVNVTVA
jgi:hypothetical protein